MDDDLRKEFKIIGNRFDGVEQHLGGVDKRFDTIDKTLASLGDHLSTIEDRLEEINRIDRLEHRFEKLREKLGVEV
jgi:archaellum component FlaC